MPTTNYFNPQAVNPGTAFKPDGFLGGYIWGQDRERYNQLAPLQDYMAQMSAMEQMDKMKEYGLNEQVRASEREANIAKNRTTASTIGRKAEADISKVELDNQYNQGSLKDRIKQVALENAVKEGAAGQAKLKQGIQIAQMYAQASKSGPAAMAAIDQMVAQTGMQNDPMVQAFKQNPAILGPLMQGLIEADADFQKEMAKIHERGKEDRKTEGVRGANQLAVARERQSSREKSLKQMLLSAKTPAERKDVASIILAEPEVDPALRRMAQAALSSAVNTLEANRDPRYQQVIPGMPQPQRTPYGAGSEGSSVITNPDPLGLFK